MVKRALLCALLSAFAVSSALAEQASVPAGTTLHCRLAQTITTQSNHRGDPFTATVSEPLIIDGREAIPVGARIEGRISWMQRPGRIRGVGEVRLTPEKVVMPDGSTVPLSAILSTVYGAEGARVKGEEGGVKGSNSRMRDLEEIGAGMGGGGLVGTLFGGLHGAVIGGVIGGAAGLVRHPSPARARFGSARRHSTQLPVDARARDPEPIRRKDARSGREGLAVGLDRATRPDLDPNSVIARSARNREHGVFLIARHCYTIGMNATPLDNAGRNSYHDGMKTVVSEKGQITIPKPLRVRLGLRKGQVLEVSEERGRLVMCKQRPLRDAVDDVYGILELRRSTDEIIDELRGRDRPK